MPLTDGSVVQGHPMENRRVFQAVGGVRVESAEPVHDSMLLGDGARNATEITRPMDDMWGRYIMALDNVSERLERITRCLDQAGVCYALVGGQAVALWVATVDPSAVRTTKDIDLLLDRAALPTAREAARSIGMDYFETMGVGMFIDRAAPNPRHGVHIVWAGEKVRPGNPVPAPTLDDRQTLQGGRHVVSLPKLVEMKLTAFRDQDRVHLRDMLDVGLIDRSVTQRLPRELSERLGQIT